MVHWHIMSQKHHKALRNSTRPRCTNGKAWVFLSAPTDPSRPTEACKSSTGDVQGWKGLNGTGIGWTGGQQGWGVWIRPRRGRISGAGTHLSKPLIHLHGSMQSCASNITGLSWAIMATGAYPEETSSTQKQYPTEYNIAPHWCRCITMQLR